MPSGSALVAWVNATPPKTRVIWLGLCCWAVAVLLPSVHRASQLALSAWLMLGLAPLLLGLGTLLFKRYPRTATYTLLSGYPVALALSMSRFEHELALITYSPTTLVVSLLSLGAYAASVSQMGAAHEPERAVEHKPLGEVPPVDLEGRRQSVGLAVLAIVTSACTLSVFYGSWQSPADYREQWGRAAPTGAVLTALLAGLVGCLAVAFIAPGLRAERKRGRRKRNRVKRVTRPLLTALTLATLYLLARATR